jgi:hypothetical protein
MTSLADILHLAKFLPEKCGSEKTSRHQKSIAPFPREFGPIPIDD